MKRVNESGINQCLAVNGAIWSGLAECALREEGWFLTGLCLCRVLRCFDVVLFLQRVGKRTVHCEVGTWYAIAVGCPGAEVGQLASFRAEGTPGIAFPRSGLVTEGAGHARQYIMPNLRIGQRLTRLDLGRGGDLQ